MILIMIKMIWHDLHLLKEPSPKRFMKPLSAEWHLISEMDQEKSNYDTIAIRANTPPPRPLQEISRSNINIYQHISTVWSLLLRTSYSLTTCTNISAVEIHVHLIFASPDHLILIFWLQPRRPQSRFHRPPGQGWSGLKPQPSRLRLDMAWLKFSIA